MNRIRHAWEAANAAVSQATAARAAAARAAEEQRRYLDDLEDRREGYLDEAADEEYDANQAAARTRRVQAMYFENEDYNDEHYNAAVEAARAADSAARRAAEEDRVLRLAAGLPLNERIRYPNRRPTYEDVYPEHIPNLPPKYTRKAKTKKSKLSRLKRWLTRRKSPKPPPPYVPTNYVNMPTPPPDYRVGGKKKHKTKHKHKHKTKHKTKYGGFSLRRRKTIKRRR